MNTSRICALLLPFLFSACGRQLVEFPQTDGAHPDRPEAATLDGLVPDANTPDVVAADLAATEVANADTLHSDVVSVDAGTADGRNDDVANTDVANTDVADSPIALADAAITGDAATDSEALDSLLIDVPFIDASENDASDLPLEGTDLASNESSVPGPTIVVNLGLASPFAIAATSGVTNTATAPITHVNGNVSLSPTGTCNGVTVGSAGGFGLCGGMAPIIDGTVITNGYPDTTTAAAIKADMNAAFLSLTPLAGPPAVGSLAGGTAIAAPTTLGNAVGSALVLGDNVFAPGVYISTTSILITGDLTLDGQGDPNAAFVFQSASTLTTADGAPNPGPHTRILLTNGTKASNVWWQVASSATIGTATEFKGNIMAAFDITMKTGATACGRSMAGAWVGGAGTYVFDSNVVSVPGNGCPL
jgi:hypothetical protein